MRICTTSTNYMCEDPSFQSMRKKQECPKGEKLVDLHVKIPSGLMKKLSKRAFKEDRTLAHLVVDILNGYFPLSHWFEDIEVEGKIEWKDADFDLSHSPGE